VNAVLSLTIFGKEPLLTAQQPIPLQQQKIVEVMSAFFAAAHDDDLAKFHGIVVPGFYAFDNGVRFDGDALMDLLKSMHAAGKRFDWHVTEPDIHINGNTAWIAYINKGSITNASTTTDQQWLESAFLEKQSGEWKIVFMHSTRVPSPPSTQLK
jgi:ketosteroid isomerase-like protein